MAEKARYSIKKIVTASIWFLLGVGIVVLLVAAINKNETETVRGVNVEIKGKKRGFVNEKEVKSMVLQVMGTNPSETLLPEVDLKTMENNLRKNEWISRAELFFDNKNILQVKISEKEPVARIFTNSGRTFYIDSSLSRLPVTETFTMRLPVFTGFPTDVKILKKEDSMLMKDIKTMAIFLNSNEFWMAQIDQIDITAARKFELVPKMGNQIIRFGRMKNYEEKFNNLFAFYKRVQMKTGWNKYSVLDVQYKNQVVALKRDSREFKADSMLAVKIMKKLIEDAEKKLRDTSAIQLPQTENRHIDINRSREIEDYGEQEIKTPPVKNSVSVQQVPTRPAVTEQRRTTVNQPATVERTSAKKQKPVPVQKVKKRDAPAKEEKRIPKAVMPPGN